MERRRKDVGMQKLKLNEWTKVDKGSETKGKWIIKRRRRGGRKRDGRKREGDAGSVMKRNKGLGRRGIEGVVREIKRSGMKRDGGRRE